MPRWQRAIMTTSLLALMLALSGCMSGAIYTHTTVPLDVNFDGTSQQRDHTGGSWKTLVIPLYVVNLQFDWGSLGIGDAMERAGINTVEYADLETFSVLGIWTKRTVHVYGN